MNGTCFECKFMRNRTNLEPCEHCTNTFAMTGVHPSFTPKKPPLTNADRIRNMTDEELAEVIKNPCDMGLRVPNEWCKKRNCGYQCSLDWLREEAEE